MVINGSSQKNLKKKKIVIYSASIFYVEHVPHLVPGLKTKYFKILTFKNESEKQE